MLILFVIIPIILNIYCFMKNKYLNFFAACMLFLPEYYGFNIGDKFPVVSAVRLMYLIFLSYCIKNRKNKLSDFVPFLKNNICIMCLLGFYAFSIITNLYYFSSNNWAIKAVFEIILEQMIMIICIWLLAPSYDDINDLIRVIVNVAVIHFIIGIFESFTQIRPFDVLYTVSGDVLNAHFTRMGVLRATTTFGLPGIYGNMCVLMIPLLIYQIRRTGNKIYLLHMFLCAMAIIHSGSRADIFFAVFISVLYTIYNCFSDRSRWKDIIIDHIVVIFMVLATILIISAFSEKFSYFYMGTFKSVLNEAGAEYDLDENAPSESGGYGDNQDGSYSRIAQFSGIKYALSHNPLFGLGYGAQTRREIKYFYHGEWKESFTYDVGYVQVLMDGGLIGALGYMLLKLFMFIGAFQVYKKEKKLGAVLFFYSLAYFVCMLSTANMRYLLLFGYSLVLMGLIGLENNECNNTKKIIDSFIV